MLKLFGKKKKNIKISLSIPIFAKARCKFCNSYPSKYYRYKGTFYYFDNERMNNDENLHLYTYRFSPVGVEIFEPKNIILSTLSCDLVGKFVPTLHYKRGLSFVLKENLVCECGSSIWRFEDLSTRNRPSISNRKSKNAFLLKLK